MEPEMATTHTTKRTTTEHYKQAANRGEPYRKTYACPSRRQKIDRGAAELGSVWYATHHICSNLGHLIDIDWPDQQT